MNFKEQRENYRLKKISAKEAVQESLVKIKNDKLNIFINHFEKQALANAEHIDNNFNDFKDKPLSGIPIAHKDIFCTEGLPTTCGRRCLKTL